MTFSERMQEMIEKGLAASKDLAQKAGSKARELGAKGTLKVEMLQLQSQAEKLIAKLGHEVYVTLVDKGQATISKDSPAVRDALTKIEALRDTIEARQKEFDAIGGKE